MRRYRRLQVLGTWLLETVEPHMNSLRSEIVGERAPRSWGGPGAQKIKLDGARAAARARRLLSRLRHSLRLYPMHAVFRELRRRGVATTDLSALEVFGGDGGLHTIDYARQVGALEIWELDPKFEPALRQRFPDARVRICDAYAAVSSEGERFDLIVVDNPLACFGAGKNRCEHFDLFPDVFKRASSTCIMILNVWTSATPLARRAYPYVFSDLQLSRRAQFYETNTPDNIPLADLTECYRRVALDEGFHLDWWFSRSRWFFHYLVLRLSRLT